MPVSQSPALSSIDLSGLPVEVAEAVAQVVDFCRNQARSDTSAPMLTDRSAVEDDALGTLVLTPK